MNYKEPNPAIILPAFHQYCRILAVKHVCSPCDGLAMELDQCQLALGLSKWDAGSLLLSGCPNHLGVERWVGMVGIAASWDGKEVGRAGRRNDEGRVEPVEQSSTRCRASVLEACGLVATILWPTLEALDSTATLKGCWATSLTWGKGQRSPAGCCLVVFRIL